MSTRHKKDTKKQVVKLVTITGVITVILLSLISAGCIDEVTSSIGDTIGGILPGEDKNPTVNEEDKVGKNSDTHLNDTENSLDTGDTTDKILSVPSYLDEYKVTPSLSLRNIYKDDNKNVLYIVYNLGSVEGIALHQLSTPMQKTDDSETLKITDTSITYNSMKTNCENILTEIIGRKVTDQNYAGITASISASALGVTAGIESTISETLTKEENWETTQTIINRLEKEVSELQSHTEEYSISFKNLENGKYYRYVMKGDAEITQTFVYDMDTNKIIDMYYNLEDVHNVGISLESSKTRSFNYDTVKNLALDSIDTDYLYLGSGTESDPYQIYIECDLELAHINPDKYYKLCSNVYANVNPWSNEYSSLHIDPSYYKLNTRDGSEEHPYTISTADEFKRIYNDLSAHYEIISDIDLSGLTIPEDTIFTGRINGNNHTLKNMEVIVPDTKFTSPKSFGLFSENKGTIENLNIDDSNLIANKQLDGEMVYIGIITGINSGTINEVTVSGCSINCERTGSSAGFICGKNAEDGEITRTSVIGKGRTLVSNGHIGGITGLNYGRITSCSVEGNGTDTVFLSHWQYAKNTANHGGEGMYLGGIVGGASSTSVISKVSVNNIYIYIYVSGLADPGYYGYVVGFNKGKVINPISVTNVKSDIGRGTFEWFLNPQIEGLGSCTDHYFKVANGYYGYNKGSTPN